MATSSFPLFIIYLIYLIFKDNCFFKLKKKGYTSIRTTNELLGPFERILVAIVFKPGFVVGLVQGPGSGFWPGHRVGWVNLYFKKIQNYVVLIKKKQKSMGCNRVLPGQPVGSAGSHRVMIFSIFSSIRSGSSHGSTH